MELGNIENLELYVDRKVEYKNGSSEIKRVPLENDLDIGETAYFRKSERNKVVKHDEDNYMFYRFDEIQTHIEDHDSGYSIEDISREINSNLDYDIEYTADRVKLVKGLIEKNSWIYDLLSSNRIIQKEQKKKSNLLAEDQALDRQISFMADYILLPKFNDKESEDYYKDIKEKHANLRKKTGKTEQEIKEMIDLKDEIDLINQGIITKSRERRNELREDKKADLNNIESEKVVADPAEFTHEKLKIDYVGRDLEIDEDYWDKMGFSEEGAKFRKEVMKTYEEAIDILAEQLGHGQDSKIKEKTERETLNSLELIEYEDNAGIKKNISPERRLSGLKRMYSELKSDYYRAKEIMAVPIEFTQLLPNTTRYEFNNDTWYEDNDGEIVELSKNTLLFSDINTYKGLISNYYSLKDRCKDNFQDDMWYILLTFEDLVKRTKLNVEEKFVLERIMRDYSRKEIVEEYEVEFGKHISMRVISSWVNRVIPGKLLNTYLDGVNEWLYTYKIKGKFKQCGKCSEIKTINNERFFRKDPLGKDNFRSQCRKCEVLAKSSK